MLSQMLPLCITNNKKSFETTNTKNGVNDILETLSVISQQIFFSKIDSPKKL